MNKTLFFFVIVALIGVCSCRITDKEVQKAYKKASERCAKTINGLGVVFYNYPADSLLPINLKIKHYSDGHIEEINDTVPHQTQDYEYRAYTLHQYFSVQDTIWVSTPNQPTKKVHSFQYKLKSCYSMLHPGFCCKLDSVTEEGKGKVMLLEFYKTK